jgi:uncharacterized membrane protein YfhO
MLVSFDVVSLFTKVPVKETMDVLGRHFEENTIALFRHVLSTSYFTFNGEFYRQTYGVAMGSPLSPVMFVRRYVYMLATASVYMFARCVYMLAGRCVYRLATASVNMYARG